MITYIRSGPLNYRSQWHIANPFSKVRNAVLCTVSVSGPSTDDPDLVGESGLRICTKCEAKRDERVAVARDVLSAFDQGSQS